MPFVKSKNTRKGVCGPERIRTADLFIANEALYQLSYGPFWGIYIQPVGVEGIGPSTSFLSGTRSTTEPHARSLIFLFKY